MVKVIVAFIIIHWCLLPSAAQTVKPITVSQQASYTDHITLKADASDKDLMVKFVFNEANNTLSVRLLSYRTLFVFWDKTRYKGTIRRRWIRPDRLSYVVTSNPEDRFRLTKAFCKSLPQPYKKHVFRKWIEYEGLQPTDTALQMVNDYIEQTFNIQGKRNNVTIRLRDLMLMDEVRHKGNGSTYEVSFGKDLNTEYQVTIERNPCFGLEGQVASAQQSLAAVSKSWATFKKRYGKGTVPSDETMKNFRDLKATLVQQFPVNTDDSPCPDVLQAYEQYNQIVDSLTKMKVTVQQADVIGQTSIVFDTKDRAKNAKVVFANARQIDSMVSRWLTSRDELERADLVSQCRSIIKDTDIILKSGGILTPEERNAANIFRQAEKYFNKTCR
jgi:hypothetical protein